MIGLSITDESFVNEIDWSEIGFHIKYVIHNRIHPITCVAQVPGIV